MNRRSVFVSIFMSAALLSTLASCSAGTDAELDKILSSLSVVNDELSDKQVVIESLEAVNVERKIELSDLEDELLSLQTDYDAYKEEMAPFEEMNAAVAEASKAEAEMIKASIEAEEQVRIELEASVEAAIIAEAELSAAAAEAAAESEAAAAEAVAEAERLAKEKQGYDTGITFSQLARTPDDYEFEKVKFTGTVVQVMDGDDTITIRFAINDDYDQMLYCEYDPAITTQRVLDNDTLTIYGVSYGIFTYESTMGASITIPAVVIDKIEFN